MDFLKLYYPLFSWGKLVHRTLYQRAKRGTSWQLVQIPAWGCHYTLDAGLLYANHPRVPKNKTKIHYVEFVVNLLFHFRGKVLPYNPKASFQFIRHGRQFWRRGLWKEKLRSNGHTLMKHFTSKAWKLYNNLNPFRGEKPNQFLAICKKCSRKDDIICDQFTNLNNLLEIFPRVFQCFHSKPSVTKKNEKALSLPS